MYEPIVRTLRIYPWMALLSVLTLALALIPLGSTVANAQTADGPSLTDGAVFAMSNARDGNVVVAYHRAADGTLTEAGRFDTDGAGSGSFEDTANGLVLATTGGEISPNNLVEPTDGETQLLFATNAGSNTVSVFRVDDDGLELVDVQDSGGEKPVSVTVNDGIVYVLNSGETNDDLFDADGNVIANCTTGFRPSVSGFRLSDDGELHAIRGSRRRLSGESVSGCAQVSFNPAGTVLVATERLAQPRRLDQQRSDEERIDDEGVIDTFAVNRRTGRLSRAHVQDATGQGPFGFTFAKNGNLLTTEQFDGPGPIGLGRGAATSYQFDDKGKHRFHRRGKYRSGRRGDLVATAPSLRNGGTDTCWFVATDDGALGFTTSFFADGRISSYRLDDVGIVELIDPVATSDDAAADDVAMGASDIALSGDSGYLYQLNSINGTINAFANNGDGTLALLEQVAPFPQEPFGPDGGMGAPIGLAAN
ncbi:hypothetical protein BH23ACT10_BH23ACT10_23900 [soil metagenome]